MQWCLTTRDRQSKTAEPPWRSRPSGTDGFWDEVRSIRSCEDKLVSHIPRLKLSSWQLQIASLRHPDADNMVHIPRPIGVRFW